MTLNTSRPSIGAIRALKELADRQAITDVIYRYCRAMDRMDRQVGYAVWHDDGVADYGAVFRGTGRGFVDFAYQAHSEFIGQSHQVTNIIIELDNDLATSESYLTAALRIQQAERPMQLTIRGRYLDRWSLRFSRWAIDSRVFVKDMDEMREVSPQSQPEGTRDTTDASYALLSRTVFSCE